MTSRSGLKLFVVWLLAAACVAIVIWFLRDARRLGAGEVGPTFVLKIETAIHKDLVENSVAVTSVSQPGLIFGFNDSGNEPRIFAFDSSGRGRGDWRVDRARNLADAAGRPLEQSPTVLGGVISRDETGCGGDSPRGRRHRGNPS